MKKGLFVYGTLRPDHAPCEIRELVKHLIPLGKGTVRGHLYDLGEYPALITKGKGTPVPGFIFALPDDPEVLRKLDDYEEFDPKNPSQSLFRREEKRVTMSDGRQRNHWVYVYNSELPQTA